MCYSKKQVLPLHSIFLIYLLNTPRSKKLAGPVFLFFTSWGMKGQLLMRYLVRYSHEVLWENTSHETFWELLSWGMKYDFSWGILWDTSHEATLVIYYSWGIMRDSRFSQDLSPRLFSRESAWEFSNFVLWGIRPSVASHERAFRKIVCTDVGGFGYPRVSIQFSSMWPPLTMAIAMWPLTMGIAMWPCKWVQQWPP